MRRLTVFVALLAIGCGKSKETSSTESSGENAKALLKDPISRADFEKAVLGRSTREITELLGPPLHVVTGEKTTGWQYRPNAENSRSGAILIFREDRVVKVDWGLD